MLEGLDAGRLCSQMAWTLRIIHPFTLPGFQTFEHPSRQPILFFLVFEGKII
jgi:hypothetical protein